MSKVNYVKVKPIQKLDNDHFNKIISLQTSQKSNFKIKFANLTKKIITDMINFKRIDAILYNNETFSLE